MVAINFSHPIYLWFLFSLPILIVSHTLAFNKTNKNALKFANFEAISRISGQQFIKKNVFLLVFRIIILFLIILSVSGTTITYIGKSTGSNYILALDTSASMLVEDIQPNRITAAKETLFSFLDFIPKQTKVGLVSFSGIVLIENQIETDFNKLKTSINKLDISQIGGTDIGNAIVTSTNMLINEKDEKSKVIILITDGQSNIGIPLENAIKYAIENNILINTIGIGSEQGGQFIGTDVVSKLDEDSLKFIAAQTDGNYYKAETKEKLKESFNKISKTSKKSISLELSFTFLFLALILILLEWGLINTKNKIIP